MLDRNLLRILYIVSVLSLAMLAFPDALGSVYHPITADPQKTTVFGGIRSDVFSVDNRIDGSPIPRTATFSFTNVPVSGGYGVYLMVAKRDNQYPYINTIHEITICRSGSQAYPACSNDITYSLSGIHDSHYVNYWLRVSGPAGFNAQLVFTTCSDDQHKGCTPGETTTESCGSCGTRPVKCTDQCIYGPAGECTVPASSCAPGSISFSGCGADEVKICNVNCGWGNCQPKVECTNNDVVLVTDTSGSMSNSYTSVYGTYPKLSQAKSAAISFINSIFNSPYNNVGIVRFAQVAISFRGLSAGSGKARLIDDIQAYVAEGQTCIACGLYRAVSMFGDYTQSQRKGSIVLMTDGKANVASYSEYNPDTKLWLVKDVPALINDAKAKGIRIYTVGFGTDVDTAQLADIASRTNGQCYIVSTTIGTITTAQGSCIKSNDIVDIYNNALASACGSVLISADTQSGNAPLTVAFTSKVYPGSQSDYTYAWDFNGDGITDSTALSPRNTFSKGTHRVTLKATKKGTVPFTAASNTLSITVGDPVCSPGDTRCFRSPVLPELFVSEKCIKKGDGAVVWDPNPDDLCPAKVYLDDTCTTLPVSWCMSGIEYICNRQTIGLEQLRACSGSCNLFYGCIDEQCQAGDRKCDVISKDTKGSTVYGIKSCDAAEHVWKSQYLCPKGCSADGKSCKECLAGETKCETSGGISKKYSCLNGKFSEERTCKHGCSADLKACGKISTTCPNACSDCGSGLLNPCDKSECNACIYGDSCYFTPGLLGDALGTCTDCSVISSCDDAGPDAAKCSAVNNCYQLANSCVYDGSCKSCNRIKSCYDFTTAEICNADRCGLKCSYQGSVCCVDNDNNGVCDTEITGSVDTLSYDGVGGWTRDNLNPSPAEAAVEVSSADGLYKKSYTKIASSFRTDVGNAAYSFTAAELEFDKLKEGTYTVSVSGKSHDQDKTLDYGSIASLLNVGGVPELKFPPRCGNGFAETGEACDDGNKNNADGCLADCKAVEEGYTCPLAGAPCEKIIFNNPPVLEPLGTLDTDVFSTFAFILPARDPDGDMLTYRAEGLPPGATLDSSGKLIWIPQVRASFTVTFTVSDGKLSASQTATLRSKSFCGDREVQQVNDYGIAEACDADSIPCRTLDQYKGTQTCMADCSGYGNCVAYEGCGDFFVNGNEACELGYTQSCLQAGYGTYGISSGTAVCSLDCKQWDTSSCRGCGDGRVDPGEECDGGSLDCSILSDYYPDYFFTGTMGCLWCQFDESNCRICGDLVNDCADCADAISGKAYAFYDTSLIQEYANEQCWADAAYKDTDYTVCDTNPASPSYKRCVSCMADADCGACGSCIADSTGRRTCNYGDNGRCSGMSSGGTATPYCTVQDGMGKCAACTAATEAGDCGFECGACSNGRCVPDQALCDSGYCADYPDGYKQGYSCYACDTFGYDLDCPSDLPLCKDGTCVSCIDNFDCGACGICTEDGTCDFSSDTLCSGLSGYCTEDSKTHLGKCVQCTPETEDIDCGCGTCIKGQCIALEQSDASCQDTGFSYCDDSTALPFGCKGALRCDAFADRECYAGCRNDNPLFDGTLCPTDRPWCEYATGNCVQCGKSSDCSGGLICSNGGCIFDQQQSDEKCKLQNPWLAYSTTDGRCVQCLHDAQCGNGQVCVSNKCQLSAAYTAYSTACTINGKCDFDKGENKIWCPSDCKCGDGICDAVENDKGDCKPDCFCNHNNKCEPGIGETTQNCEKDCPGKPCKKQSDCGDCYKCDNKDIYVFSRYTAAGQPIYNWYFKSCVYNEQYCNDVDICGDGIDNDHDGCQDDADVGCGGKDTTCDLKDDNCDGQIDEDVDLAANPECANVCPSDGIKKCENNKAYTCSAPSWQEKEDCGLRGCNTDLGECNKICDSAGKTSCSKTGQEVLRCNANYEYEKVKPCSCTETCAEKGGQAVCVPDEAPRCYDVNDNYQSLPQGVTCKDRNAEKGYADAAMGPLLMEYRCDTVSCACTLAASECPEGTVPSGNRCVELAEASYTIEHAAGGLGYYDENTGAWKVTEPFVLYADPKVTVPEDQATGLIALLQDYFTTGNAESIRQFVPLYDALSASLRQHQKIKYRNFLNALGLTLDAGTSGQQKADIVVSNIAAYEPFLREIYFRLRGFQIFGYYSMAHQKLLEWSEIELETADLEIAKDTATALRSAEKLMDGAVLAYLSLVKGRHETAVPLDNTLPEIQDELLALLFPVHEEFNEEAYRTLYGQYLETKRLEYQNRLQADREFAIREHDMPLLDAAYEAFYKTKKLHAELNIEYSDSLAILSALVDGGEDDLQGEQFIKDVNEKIAEWQWRKDAADAYSSLYKDSLYLGGGSLKTERDRAMLKNLAELMLRLYSPRGEAGSESSEDSVHEDGVIDTKFRDGILAFWTGIKAKSEFDEEALRKHMADALEKFSHAIGQLEKTAGETGMENLPEEIQATWAQSLAMVQKIENELAYQDIVKHKRTLEKEFTLDAAAIDELLHFVDDAYTGLYKLTKENRMELMGLWRFLLNRMPHYQDNDEDGTDDFNPEIKITALTQKIYGNKGNINPVYRDSALRFLNTLARLADDPGLDKEEKAKYRALVTYGDSLSTSVKGTLLRSTDTGIMRGKYFSFSNQERDHMPHFIAADLESAYTFYNIFPLGEELGTVRARFGKEVRKWEAALKSLAKEWKDNYYSQVSPAAALLYVSPEFYQATVGNYHDFYGHYKNRLRIAEAHFFLYSEGGTKTYAEQLTATKEQLQALKTELYALKQRQKNGAITDDSGNSIPSLIWEKSDELEELEAIIMKEKLQEIMKEARQRSLKALQDAYTAETTEGWKELESWLEYEKALMIAAYRLLGFSEFEAKRDFYILRMDIYTQLMDSLLDDWEKWDSQYTFYGSEDKGQYNEVTHFFTDTYTPFYVGAISTFADYDVSRVYSAGAGQESVMVRNKRQLETVMQFADRIIREGHQELIGVYWADPDRLEAMKSLIPIYHARIQEAEMVIKRNQDFEKSIPQHLLRWFADYDQTQWNEQSLRTKIGYDTELISDLESLLRYAGNSVSSLDKVEPQAYAKLKNMGFIMKEHAGGAISPDDMQNPFAYNRVFKCESPYTCDWLNDYTRVLEPEAKGFWDSLLTPSYLGEIGVDLIVITGSSIIAAKTGGALGGAKAVHTAASLATRLVSFAVEISVFTTTKAAISSIRGEAAGPWLENYGKNAVTFGILKGFGKMSHGLKAKIFPPAGTQLPVQLVPTTLAGVQRNAVQAGLKAAELTFDAAAIAAEIGVLTGTGIAEAVLWEGMVKGEHVEIDFKKMVEDNLKMILAFKGAGRAYRSIASSTPANVYLFGTKASKAHAAVNGARLRSAIEADYADATLRLQQADMQLRSVGQDIAALALERSSAREKLADKRSPPDAVWQQYHEGRIKAIEKQLPLEDLDAIAKTALGKKQAEAEREALDAELRIKELTDALQREKPKASSSPEDLARYMQLLKERADRSFEYLANRERSGAITEGELGSIAVSLAGDGAHTKGYYEAQFEKMMLMTQFPVRMLGAFDSIFGRDARFERARANMETLKQLYKTEMPDAERLAEEAARMEAAGDYGRQAAATSVLEDAVNDRMKATQTDSRGFWTDPLGLGMQDFINALAREAGEASATFVVEDTTESSRISFAAKDASGRIIAGQARLQFLKEIRDALRGNYPDHPEIVEAEISRLKARFYEETDRVLRENRGKTAEEIGELIRKGIGNIRLIESARYKVGFSAYTGLKASVGIAEASIRDAAVTEMVRQGKNLGEAMIEKARVAEEFSAAEIVKNPGIAGKVAVERPTAAELNVVLERGATVSQVPIAHQKATNIIANKERAGEGCYA